MASIQFGSEQCEGIRYLSSDDLTQINTTLIELQTPSEIKGVLKPSELEMAQQRPAVFRHYDQTNDIFRIASRFMAGIIYNHPFNNANKRTAAAAGSIFLLLNGFELTGPGDQLIAILVGIGVHDYTEDDLEAWLAEWCREFDATELNSAVQFAIATPVCEWNGQ